jgi:hypothetical protein
MSPLAELISQPEAHTAELGALLDLWDMFILYAAGFAMGRTTASTSPTSTNGDT